MPVDPFDGWFRDRRVLVTGHTGFLGTWASRWLVSLGATVGGYSRGRNTPPAEVPACVDHFDGDLADRARLDAVFQSFQPDILVHLAANPSVTAAFDSPADTFASNVMGTVNLLDAALRQPSLGCVVLCGTPAVTPPDDHLRLSPYAASKHAMEAVSAAYGHPATQQRANRHTPLHIGVGRPGVMIGGDWTAGRVLPEAVQAVRAGRPVTLTAPRVARPWQHVLDGLSGLLILAASLGRQSAPRCRYDFGRIDPDQVETVHQVAEGFLAEYGVPDWPVVLSGSGDGDVLRLGCAEAKDELGWRPVWDTARSLRAAAAWYRSADDSDALATVMDDQIAQYSADATRAWDEHRTAVPAGTRPSP